MEHRIEGTVMPVLEVTLQPGERVVAESGELSWMSESINLTTSTAAAGAKGVFGAVKRALGGGTLFMTEYKAEGRPGYVAFATKVPGHILPVKIEAGQEMLVHRHGYLCGTAGVELSIGFQQSFGAGLFGGNGFILQRVGGLGDAWIELDGEVITYDLAAGETLRVHPGHVGMLEAGVGFQITRMPGIKNIIFGGDGLFLAALTGPGKVWLQTLPLPNLAHALSPYLEHDSGSGGSGSTGGGLLRSLFND